MADVQTKFEVLEVIDRPDLNAVIIRGYVRNGTTSIGTSARGMSTKVWVFSELYMRTSIKSLEYEEGNERGVAKLTLDAADPDVREAWLGLCESGDVLPIDIEA